ncbi:hypothetical protein BIW11_04856 [Tropilaelaps mercedesae]|uniref:Chitin-binding type-2 domain-containing protein n=1 Tax=Tropilaelaps mercedesae TaxID=418985 RepID=A0A1V9X0Z9_9ACAR|nr:hypothetical protein BIW11_04856 [Tropilaelaps mercedesae]
MFVWTQDRLDLPAGSALVLGEFITSFRCPNRYGYFADIDNDCKMFHVCQPTHSIEDLRYFTGAAVPRHWSFFCGNQTVFNQLTLTCSHEDEAIPCSSSPDFFYLNDNVGHIDTNFLTDGDIKGRSLLDDRQIAPAEHAKSDSMPDIPRLPTSSSVTASKALSSTPQSLPETENIMNVTSLKTIFQGTLRWTKMPRVLEVTFFRARPKKNMIEATFNLTTTKESAEQAIVAKPATRVAVNSTVLLKIENDIVDNESSRFDKDLKQAESIQKRANMSEIRPIFERLRPRISTLY